MSIPSGPGASSPAAGENGHATAPAAAANLKRVRHEFIVYFIWREPTLDQPANPAPAK